VVAHQSDREVRADFFNNFVHPLLRDCGAKELILVEGEGGASAKRNAGAARATGKYLLFWDDDCLMSKAFVPLLLSALMDSPPSVAYAYCDALEIVHPEAPRHPGGPVRLRRSRPFDAGVLQRSNYISNMSPMRRDAFPGYDESLKRLVDWDVWLTMLGRGLSGVYVPGVYYHAYYLDQGISAGNLSYDQAVREIRRKHSR